MLEMESSRIFIKGLPPKFTDLDVRKHFAKYPVTDVKFFPHRRIGYVGYKTPEDAAKAVKYFNRSFIKMSKIFVEIARPVADAALPGPRQQHTHEETPPKHDDSAPTTKENVLKRKRAHEEADRDPKLTEFLQVMQPPSKTTMWANDDANTRVEVAPALSNAGDAATGEDGSDDEYQVIVKKAKLVQDAEQPSADAGPIHETKKIPSAHKFEGADTKHATGEGAGDIENTAEPVSDSAWLRSRTNRVLDLVHDDEMLSPLTPAAAPTATQKDNMGGAFQPTVSEPNETSSATPADTAAADVSPSAEDRIRQTGRLYLRNLHFDITSDDLHDHFCKYGPLEEVHVPMKKIDGKGKGFAFLQYQNSECAFEAFKHNDGTIFQGRLLHIISAESKRDSKLDEFAVSKLSLKKQKDIKRKAGATASGFNWNSLYMNADAVMSTIADRLGVDKSAVLDPTSSDAAVKQAHAETHIIQEIKSYFSQQGVDLEAFKRSSKGDTAILVKNIPHGTSQDEIRRLFEEHGTLKKFLMPPAGLTAIVEFPNAAQARSAFGSLAYRKLKDSILYLEKAPKELFNENIVVPAQIQSTSSGLPAAKLSATDLLQDAPQSESSATATLYVRNLDFSTTTQRLSETFAPLKGFRSARVKTKVDPKRGVLSMGFGFVEFTNAESASAALSAMDGFGLDGHHLQIRASHKGVDAAEERRKEDAAKKAASTKILIKNLPFEASKKDVRALFGAYGQLRSVRVPKKFDSSSRGFGFADFVTKRDAANAMDALRNTHLLGRRLVLSFAEAETDDPEKELEKMQQKVGAQANKVALQRLTGGGRKKFNVAGNDDLDEG